MHRSARSEKSNAGRPRKFIEPSRPVTVTLPMRILKMLLELDSDRARAITRATETALAAASSSDLKRVEVVEVGPGIGLIIVGSSQRLRRIPWLQLAKIAPGRYIITIDSGTPIETIEVAIGDILDSLDKTEEDESAMLRELLKWIQTLRRGQHITKAELLFVSTRHNRSGRPLAAI